MMSDMQRQYQDSTKLMARAMIHVKYSPRGKAWSLVDTGIFKAGDRVLDVGCGPGRFWVVNAKMLPPDLDVTLADLSPGMVDEAVKNVAAADGRWTSVAGKVADVCALPFADDSFDVVTAMHMLYHAADKDQAVSQIARVLKAGGTLVATTNGTETMGELSALSQAVFGTPPFDVSSAAFSLESGETILKRHFRNVEVKTMIDVLRVTDAQDVVNYLRSFPPGDEADEPALRILDKELAMRMQAQGGTFPITRIAGYIVASGQLS